MEIQLSYLLLGQVILFIFALSFLILGIFTAYFGSGKSRIAGTAMLLVGLILGVFYAWYIHANHPGYFTNEILLPGLLYIGGTIIGLIIALGLFILIIMKT
ncbi:MAG: hypothetical protein ACP5RZ_05330 [Thermoplasmata archaeon]